MNFERKDFYGDKSRWFIGRVINNRDPDMLGRVQVRINGIHSELQSDIPQSGLPWALTALPTTEGGSSGIGRIAQIQPNAMVYGVFLDGETSQLPLVIGVLTQFEEPSRVQQASASAAGNPLTRAYLGQDSVRVPPSVNSVDTETEQGGRNRSRGGDGSGAGVNEKRFAGMEFFVANGFTAAQAAGIMGNLEAESGLDTRIVSAVEGESSQGIAQWNPAAAAGDRLGKLKRFANRIGQPWYNYSTQLQFVMHELRGVPQNFDGGSDFAHVYEDLRRCTTYEGGVSDSNSTWIFCRWYEIPANPRGKLPTRENFARTAYRQFLAGVGDF